MDKDAFVKIGAALGVCGALLSVAVVPLAVKAQGAAEPAVEEFYARYNKRDFAGALAAVTPDARPGKKVEDLQSHWDRLGAYRGRRTVAFKTKDLIGRSVYFRFRSDYEKGAADDTFRLAKNGARYELVSYPGDCPAD